MILGNHRIPDMIFFFPLRNLNLPLTQVGNQACAKGVSKHVDSSAEPL